MLEYFREPLCAIYHGRTCTQRETRVYARVYLLNVPRVKGDTRCPYNFLVDNRARMTVHSQWISNSARLNSAESSRGLVAGGSSDAILRQLPALENAFQNFCSGHVPRDSSNVCIVAVCWISKAIRLRPTCTESPDQNGRWATCNRERGRFIFVRNFVQS